VKNLQLTAAGFQLPALISDHIVLEIVPDKTGNSQFIKFDFCLRIFVIPGLTRNPWFDRLTMPGLSP
jgi:hypothetical protein